MNRKVNILNNIRIEILVGICIIMIDIHLALLYKMSAKQ